MRDLMDRPFRLGTTSFIYPDHIIPNVRKTGTFFDEIELLVFESSPREVLPSRADIQELGRLAQDLDLTYNIHLPVDVSLTDVSDAKQAEAAETLFRVIELFAPLNPTTHTLHLVRDRGLDQTSREDLPVWDKRARQGLELLVPRLADPKTLSLETLWYDPENLHGLVADFDLCLCIDAGHHFKYGQDLKTTFDHFQGRVPVVHGHGVDFSGPLPKSHTSLDRLPPGLFFQLVQCLSTYSGTLSLEVFNLQDLTRSLAYLGSIFKDIPRLPPKNHLS